MSDNNLALVEALESPVARQPDGSILDADGNVTIHVIRPGVGRGRGRHLYEADMLQRDAGVFSGWKMYVDHLAPEARKAAGGLPRGVRELGGRVLESRWDPEVPADSRFGQGAVVATVRPVKWLREMIADDPELIETSISAQATATRPVRHQGERVNLVEGIAPKPKGSVDWVTEAGAGGRVAAALREAFQSDDDIERALLEAMDDDELREYAAERGLLEAGDGDKEDEADGGDDEALENEVQKHVKKGLPRPLAVKAAKKALAEARADTSEEDDMPLTPEALAEALKANPGVIVEALKASDEGKAFLQEAAEQHGVTDEDRERIIAEARADARREVTLERLDKAAADIIAEAKLPDPFKRELREQYQLDEAGEPTAGLDLYDDVDDAGKTTKTARAKLAEAIEADVKRQQGMLREVGITRVRGQGAGAALVEASDDSSGEPMKTAKDTGYGRYLRESAGVDVDKAFALSGVGGDGE